MPFTEHKITAFQHRIADLPDQPNLPSNELKARFDSSPEELRLAHNAVCDDAARLDARVAGMIAETFGDVIPETMLAPELAGKINAKADEQSVAERLAAETKTRADADSKLTSDLSALRSTVASRMDIYADTYAGNGSELRVIHLPDSPKIVIIGEPALSYMFLLYQDSTACNNAHIPIAKLSGSTLTILHSMINMKSKRYAWVAFV